MLNHSKLELKRRNGINKTFELEPLIWGWVYQQFSKPINTIENKYIVHYSTQTKKSDWKIAAHQDLVRVHMGTRRRQRGKNHYTCCHTPYPKCTSTTATIRHTTQACRITDKILSKDSRHTLKVIQIFRQACLDEVLIAFVFWRISLCYLICVAVA